MVGAPDDSMPAPGLPLPAPEARVRATEDQKCAPEARVRATEGPTRAPKPFLCTPEGRMRAPEARLRVTWLPLRPTADQSRAGQARLCARDTNPPEVTTHIPVEAIALRAR